jgi:ectoine hydroxylase-related dioxygenase (phytanoyl-CoA dioxygenase family)
MATEGEDQLQFWISLDPVAKESSLEMVRGSQTWPTFAPPGGLGTRRSYGDALPTPDVEAARDRFDVISYGVEPGDVIVLHARTLHGGAPTREGQCRRTIIFKFYGPQTVYKERSLFEEKRRPEIGNTPEERWIRGLSTAHFEDIKTGDPFPTLYPPIYPRRRHS